MLKNILPCGSLHNCKFSFNASMWNVLRLLIIIPHSSDILKKNGNIMGSTLALMRVRESCDSFRKEVFARCPHRPIFHFTSKATYVNENVFK